MTSNQTSRKPTRDNGADRSTLDGSDSIEIVRIEKSVRGTPAYVPTDADLAYLGLTPHQIGLINTIPLSEGQNAVRQEVYDEQARLLMERDSGWDSFSRFDDVI